MKAENLVHDGIEVVQAAAICELFPCGIRVWELLLQFLTEAGLRLRLP